MAFDMRAAATHKCVSCRSNYCCCCCCCCIVSVEEVWGVDERQRYLFCCWSFERFCGTGFFVTLSRMKKIFFICTTKKCNLFCCWWIYSVNISRRYCRYVRKKVQLIDRHSSRHHPCCQAVYRPAAAAAAASSSRLFLILLLHSSLLPFILRLLRALFFAALRLAAAAAACIRFAAAVHLAAAVPLAAAAVAVCDAVLPLRLR